MTDQCKTKYPIVLVHGIALRDYPHIKYWGRVPDALKKHGASVFFGEQDGWGTIEDNAACIKNKILDVMEKLNVDKVNIIAHSKGGLDIRYLISVLGMDQHVASLTTISTPHYGSKSADLVCRVPNWFFKFISFFANGYFRLAGDHMPDFFTCFHQVTTKACNEFNQKVQDSPLVYYQSYASIMKSKRSDIKFSFTHSIINHIEGDNDGIVALNSAKWGNYKGLINKEKGGSHSDIIGFRLIKTSKVDFDQFYIKVVHQLKMMDF